jgi:hypothetical protein
MVVAEVSDRSTHVLEDGPGRASETRHQVYEVSYGFGVAHRKPLRAFFNGVAFGNHICDGCITFPRSVSYPEDFLTG